SRPSAALDASPTTRNSSPSSTSRASARKASWSSMTSSVRLTAEACHLVAPAASVLPRSRRQVVTTRRAEHALPSVPITYQDWSRDGHLPQPTTDPGSSGSCFPCPAGRRQRDAAEAHV